MKTIERIYLFWIIPTFLLQTFELNAVFFQSIDFYKRMFEIENEVSQQRSNNQDLDSLFLGFWEGPHPADENQKFYIHIENSNNLLKAKGYWTRNKFYKASFLVDSTTISRNHISFNIPKWFCKLCLLTTC